MQFHHVFASAVMAALSCAAQASEGPTVAFDRMLQHAPARGTVSAPQQAPDAMALAFEVALRRTGSTRVATAPVLVQGVAQQAPADAFDRLLNHRATSAHPDAPAGTDALMTFLVDRIGKVASAGTFGQPQTRTTMLRATH